MYQATSPEVVSRDTASGVFLFRDLSDGFSVRPGNAIDHGADGVLETGVKAHLFCPPKVNVFCQVQIL